MCPYCNNDIAHHHAYDLRNETEDINIHTNIDSDGFIIVMDWYDICRQTRMAYACNLPIQYCPWCGAKLHGEYYA